MDGESSKAAPTVRQKYQTMGHWFDPGEGQTADAPPELFPDPEYNDLVDAVIFADNQGNEDGIAGLNKIMLDLVNERFCVPTPSEGRERREGPFPDYPLGACADKACELQQSELMLSW